MLTVFLGIPTRRVNAIENLAKSILLLVSRIFQKLIPLVLAQQPTEIWVRSLDLQNNHTTRLDHRLWIVLTATFSGAHLGFMEERIERLGAYTAGNPAGELDPVVYWVIDFFHHTKEMVSTCRLPTPSWH